MAKTNQVDSKKVRPSLDRSDWMAILAVFISCGAFFVSLYEANIMKQQQEIMLEQQDIMQSQQKASVWPYLDSDLRVSVSDSYSNFTLSITNKGVGPAKIKHFTLFMDGEIMRDLRMVNDKLEPLHKEQSPTIFPSFTPPTGVISADQTMMILELKKARKDQFDYSGVSFSEYKIGYEICYCSIFGDCWTITDQTEEPKEGCEVKM